MRFPNKLVTLAFNLKQQDWMWPLLEQGKVYVVGGVVRDNFLDKSSKDIDIIIEDLSLDEIKTILNPFGKINIVGESFKVIKFRPTGWKAEDLDISTPRKDTKIGEGHKGIRAEQAKTVLEDLERRDFTINSMAFDINYESQIDADPFDGLIDPFNGLEDLQKKQLKATDEHAFVEDPLRILRGIQFAARFDFKIESNTLQLMKDNVHLMKEISGERILDEFEKILTKGGRTDVAMHLIYTTGLDEVMGKRMVFNQYKDSLDPVSFYYALAKNIGQDPVDYYLKYLKGNLKMGHAIKMLDRILSFESEMNEADARLLVMECIQNAPYLEFAVLLPQRVKKILNLMNKNIIPKSFRDLAVGGNDLKNIGFEGEGIGEAIRDLRQSALTNEFDWHDRTASLEFIKTLC